jgi:uncharacterized protein (DUF488 family)
VLANTGPLTISPLVTSSDEAAPRCTPHGSQERVAVLCFEADESRCHRQVVIEEVQRRLGRGTDERRGGQ